jgi:cytochrome P450
VRRKLLNPFFSRTSLVHIQPLMREKLTNITKRLDERADQGSSANMYNAFRCMTTDIISEYAFAQSMDLASKSDDDFDHEFLKAFDKQAHELWYFIYSPMMQAIRRWTPVFLAKQSKSLGTVFGFIEFAAAAVETARSKGKQDPSKPVVFHALDSLSTMEAVDESILFLAAGSDTTAWTLTHGLANLVDHPEFMQRLQKELRSAIPDPSQLPDVSELEKIPLLNATVKESLRVGRAVNGRLPRVVPFHGPPFIVDGKVVPPGTLVGISSHTMHTSHKIWGDDAETFNPDRWLQGHSLDEYMVAFSKGPRNCVAQNMAIMEMHITLATLLRRYDFEFVEGQGVPVGEDFFTTFAPRGTGLHLKIKRRE